MQEVLKSVISRVGNAFQKNVVAALSIRDRPTRTLLSGPSHGPIGAGGSDASAESESSSGKSCWISILIKGISEFAWGRFGSYHSSSGMGSCVVTKAKWKTSSCCKMI
jgi:hypothetical protein